MKSVDIKEFRRRNKIKQVHLAEFLGISQSFLSQVESGGRALPMDHLEKILANTEWDSSTLVIKGNIVNGSGVVVTGDNNNHIDNRHYYSDSPDVLRAQIELLDERIKEKDAQIKEKDAQIKTLLDILAKK